MAFDPINNIITQYESSITSTVEFYTSHLNKLVGPPAHFYAFHLNRLADHAGELFPSVLIGIGVGLAIPTGRPFVIVSDSFLKFTTDLLLAGLCLRVLSDGIENYQAALSPKKTFFQATKNTGAGTFSAFIGGAITLFGGMFIDAALMMSRVRVSEKLIATYIIGSVLSATSLDLYFRTQWNLTT